MDAPFVGIDRSKDSMDVHVHPSCDRFASPRDDARITALTKRMVAVAPKVIAIEATGGFGPSVLA